MSNIGSTGNTGGTGNTSPIKSTDMSEVKHTHNAPIEQVKKFEDALDKKKKESPNEDVSKNIKKEKDGPFELKNVKIPVKKEGSDLVKDQIFQDLMNKEKGKSKPKSEGKSEASKGDEKNGLQFLGKGGKTLQPVQGRTKDEGDKKGDGQEQSNTKQKEEKQVQGKTDSQVPLTPVQGLQSTTSPLGQIASVSAPQQVVSTTAVKEVVELVSSMISRMLVGAAGGNAENTVLVTIGSEVPRLEKVDVMFKIEGKSLTISLDTSKNQDASNFINQNMSSLNSSLRDGLQGRSIDNVIIKGTDINAISIDIPRMQSDTQKDDSQGRSRGRQVIPDEEEEQP